MPTSFWGIAREGYPWILIPLSLGLGAAVLEWRLAALVLILLGFGCACFFRDPERRERWDAADLVSPADGRVIAVRAHSNGPDPGEDIIQIAIFLNLFNVHVNRSPAAGLLRQIEHRPGRFLPADRDEAGLENECNLFRIQSDAGPDVVCRQIAGLVARRVVFYGRMGQRLAAGERIGLMKFSSRMDIYVPADTQVLVREGQRVRANQTRLGVLPHA